MAERIARAVAAEALLRWNPRFLATVATPEPALPILRLDPLRPPEAAALRAAAAAVGARVVVGPAGALVAGTWEEQAALAAHLAGAAAEAGAARGESAARPPPAASRRLGAALAATLAHQHGAPPAPTRLGATTWVWGERTYIMGVLNLSP